MSTLPHSRQVLLWPGTQRRRFMPITQNHTHTRDETVDLMSSSRLGYGHLYALGVE